MNSYVKRYKERLSQVKESRSRCQWSQSVPENMKIQIRRKKEKEKYRDKEIYKEGEFGGQ